MHEFTPQMYRVARAMVGESAAPDVVQEVFLDAWRHLRQLRDPERFAAWLQRICVNRCRSALRRTRHVREISLRPAHEDVSTRDVRSNAEIRAVLMPALLRLSLDQRSVIALHYAAGLTIAETAAALGIPAGTAKSRLNAGLAVLRRALEGTGD